MPPDGVPKLELDPGKRHEIVVHIPGGEPPGATVPQQGVAPAGMALPKVGEKWSTSAPTGQGSAAIVVPLPAARGVTPQLAIAYSTTGGNGPFGWGWRGPVPYFERTTTKAIVRAHGRGVPEYDDANESDVFAFSDADELVKTGEGLDAKTGAVVVTYRARTEGGFARIERHELGGRSHFVVHDGSGIVSIFGLADEAAVADPSDPKRVFRWLLQEQRDVLGNVAVYRYQADDAQRYLRRILYGNRDVPLDEPIDPTSLEDEAARARFMFEVVLEYGVRADPFFSGRAGFPVVTRELCRRVCVFHRFTQLAADAAPVLTRILELGYDKDPAGSRLVSVALNGVGEESSITLPARRFTYAARTIGADVRTIDDVGALDLSLPGIDAELFDLHGDGDAGLLTREHGRFVFRPRTRTGFGEGTAIPFAATPSTDPSVHVQRWLDVGTGLPSLVEFGPSDATVFHRDAHGKWQAAQVAAGNTPPVGKDPIAERHRIYLTDLDGDGIADVLVASEGKYVWWRRMGSEPGDGWQEQPPIEHDGDEAKGPGPVLFDAARDLASTPHTEAIVIADMTGDGLPDVVRVRADEIAYWPNLGRGRFGGKVVIGEGSGFAIDEACVRACDIDGTGPASLLLLQREGGGTLWINEAGNRLVRGPSVSTPPLRELALSSLGRVDGSPVASFVWAPKVEAPTITIVDFARGAPWLLVCDESGTGARTTIQYSTAAEHARRCADEGRPWRTRLPIAMSVVDSVVARDLARGTVFSSSYRYAHGHWDPIERELRGFAFVEQRDTDGITTALESKFQTNIGDLTSAPARTRSWFFVDADVDLSDEYDRSDPHAVILPPPDLSAFSGDDRREAARALRGVALRSERYTDDADLERAPRPWVTTTQAWIVRSVQDKGAGHHASMLPLAEQTLTYTGDREATADPRLVQTAALEHDELGFATRTAVVTYPRRRAVPEPDPVPPRKVDPDPANNVMLRAIGFAFDTDKSFVLPAALPGLAVLAAQCRAHGSGEVLVVGHTDRTGDVDDNLGISLQRARRVVEYLRGDVDAWMLLFDPSMPASIRWGAHEDAQMIAALGHGGELTRRELVQQYMALAGPPVDVAMHAVGAGEGFVVDVTDDGVSSAANRRIEAFFFSGAVDPPAPEKFVAADASEYATWIARASQRADVDAATGAVVLEANASPTPLGAEPRPAAADSRAPKDDPQLRTAILVAEVDLVHQQEADLHRLGTVVEQRSFEVTGKRGDPLAPLPIAALKAAASGGAEIPFEQAPSGAHERRLVSRTRQSFYDDALVKEAPLGVVGKRALPAKTRRLAFTEAQAKDVLGPMLAASEDATKLLESAGYLKADGGWWVVSSRVVFDADAFYQPVETVDPFGTLVERVTYDRDRYLVVRRTSYPPGGNPLMSSASFEYRSFGARGSFDPNGSATIRRFDALGRVVSEVRRGDPSGGETEAPEDSKGVRARDYGSEGDDDDAPTIVYTYDDHAFAERGTPCSVTRAAKLEYGGRDIRVSLGVTFFDGAGGELQSKVRTDDGRWRSSGRTVVDHRGLPVLQFGAWISGSAGYDAGSGQLMVRMHYDALDRLVRTDYLDGTHERSEPGTWETTTWDRNDAVLQSEWLEANGGRAGMGAVAHADTPTTVRMDVLGRPVAVFQRYRDEAGAMAVVVTRTHLDVSGNVREVIDARGNVAESRVVGMLGQVLVTTSVDAGQSRSVSDVLGAPLLAMDARGCVFFAVYDALRRPIEDWIRVPGQGEVLVGKRVWGDGENDGAAGGTRQRGRLVRVYDGGGTTSIDAYDLDGQATKVVRRLVDLPRVMKTAQVEGRAPRARTDWSALGGITKVAELDAMMDALELLESERRVTTSKYDARGRVIETSLPLSGSTHRMRYTEDGLVHRIDRETAAGTEERVYLVEAHDHLGRPVRAVQGDGVRTSWTYDVITERLLRLQTTGGGRSLQDLQYTYDPMGNIVQVRDAAQAVVYAGNAELAASNDYRYDALYRLVEATGREHEGQAANGAGPAVGSVPLRVVSPNDPKGMRRYAQRYRYDAVGNLTSLQHFAGAGSYRREYAYGEHGNRLRATGAGAGALHERYEHDVAGNMIAMPHLSRLHWDELGQLEYARCGTQHVWLQYAGGVRVRKVVFSGEGVVEDRVYLGGEELYTKRRAGAVVEKTLTEHAGGGLQVDVRLVVDGKTIAKPVGLRRYAIADHLGSCKLEVDESGKVIAYEEFHPYGTTSYRAMRGSLDAAANRFRFTGVEKDEETGLAQHGARYYAAWLGRWTTGDPIGVAGGINLYAYAANAPTQLVDRTGSSPCAPDDLTCESDGDEYASDLGTGMTDAEEAELPGSTDAYFDERDASKYAPPTAFEFATLPHRFFAGQVVGFVEGSWDLATALPKLGWALYDDSAAVRARMRQRWEKEGILGFTPLPGLWTGVTGVLKANDAFEAGRSLGHAQVNMAETLGAVVVTAATARSLGSAIAELAAKSLATRGILFTDLLDLSGLAGAATEAVSEIGRGAAVGARLVTPRWSPSIPSVATPWGPANQALSKTALAARAKVAEGATLYRVGTTGKSNTVGAQFWALEHPNTPGFAARYGIPPENVAAANFIQTATLKPGRTFVTRVAPPVGSNPGGGIEVVVEETGFIMQSFSHFGF